MSEEKNPIDKWESFCKKGYKLMIRLRKAVVVWIIIPSLAIASTFVIRFLFFEGYWYFHINIAISMITCLYVFFKPKTNLKYAFIFFQPFIILLYLLSIMPYSITSSIIHFIRTSGAFQALLGFLSGFIGIYVYFLGTKINVLEEEIENLKIILGFSTLISIIVALGLFSLQTTLHVLKWVLRPLLLISSLMIGCVILTLGVINNGSKNMIVHFLAFVFIFSLAFIMGTLIIPFTSIGQAIFPSQVAFFSNSLLLTGIIGYRIGNEEFFQQILKKIFKNKESVNSRG